MNPAPALPVSWFNPVRLPDLASKSHSLYHTMVEVHATLAIAPGLIVALHVAPGRSGIISY